MAEHNEFGNTGETIAQESLLQNGYKILETNWHHRHKEVDIIAEKNNMIVFIEVKTRKSAFFGEPELFVTREKQKSYIQVANAYVLQNHRKEEVQFDIIAIVLNSLGKHIKHIENAFSAIL